MYGLSFMLKDNKNKKFFEYLFAPTHTVQIEKKLQQIIDERNILQETFNQIDIIHHNRLNTLVPQEIFNPETARSLLEKNIKLLANDTVAHEPIDTLEAVNIYVPFDKIKGYLKAKQINEKHSATIFLRQIKQIRQQSDFMPVFEIFLNIFPHDFQIAVFKNEKLELYNHFAYENEDEFLYYLFFVTETLEINQNNMHIYVAGVDKLDENVQNLSDFTSNYSLIPEKNPSQINNFL